MFPARYKITDQFLDIVHFKDQIEFTVISSSRPNNLPRVTQVSSIVEQNMSELCLYTGKTGNTSQYAFYNTIYQSYIPKMSVYLIFEAKISLPRDNFFPQDYFFKCSFCLFPLVQCAFTSCLPLLYCSINKVSFPIKKKA